MLDGSLEVRSEILEETLFENSFLRKMLESWRYNFRMC